MYTENDIYCCLYEMNQNVKKNIVEGFKKSFYPRDEKNILYPNES